MPIKRGTSTIAANDKRWTAEADVLVVLGSATLDAVVGFASSCCCSNRNDRRTNKCVIGEGYSCCCPTMVACIVVVYQRCRNHQKVRPSPDGVTYWSKKREIVRWKVTIRCRPTIGRRLLKAIFVNSLDWRSQLPKSWPWSRTNSVNCGSCIASIVLPIGCI